MHLVYLHQISFLLYCAIYSFLQYVNDILSFLVYTLYIISSHAIRPMLLCYSFNPSVKGCPPSTFKLFIVYNGPLKLLRKEIPSFKNAWISGKSSTSLIIMVCLYNIFFTLLLWPFLDTCICVCLSYSMSVESLHAIYKCYKLLSYLYYSEARITVGSAFSLQ